MHFTISSASWDRYVGAALLVVLFIGFFKLDTIIGAPRKRSGPNRPASGKDAQGRPVYSDPDGKPWKRRRKA